MLKTAPLRGNVNNGLVNLRVTVNEIFQLIQSCIKNGDAEQGRELQRLVLRYGLQSDAFLGANLIRMFASFHSLSEAKEVFHNLPQPSAFAWSAIISAHADLGHSAHAIELYARMYEANVKPDTYVHVAVLKACSNIGDFVHGFLVHSYIVENDNKTDGCIGNTLIAMYAKCDFVIEAQNVFDTLTERNVVTWTAMISCYAQHGSGYEAISLFYEMQKRGIDPNKVTFVNVLKACSLTAAWNEGTVIHTEMVEMNFHIDVFVASILIDMYVKCGSLRDSHAVFNEVQKPDVVTWNAVIAGSASHGCVEDTLLFLRRMQAQGVRPDVVTFISLLKLFSNTNGSEDGNWVHMDIIKAGLENDISISNALIEMYMNHNCINDAGHVFGKMSGKDVISWSSMIAGFVHHDEYEAALQLLYRMEDNGVKPNQVTYLSILKACSSLTEVNEGKLVHGYLVESGFDSDECIRSSLVEMYAKHCSLRDAIDVFDRGKTQDLVSWSVILSACAHNRDFKTALKYFQHMKLKNLEPDDATFVSLLSGCSQAGLVNHGLEIFRSVSECFNITPNIEVCNCMVDMLGRAGCLLEGVDLMLSLPYKCNLLGWTSLLEHCKNHRNRDLGNLCFQKLSQTLKGMDVSTVVANLLVQKDGLVTLDDVILKLETFSDFFKAEKELPEIVGMIKETKSRLLRSEVKIS